MGGIPRLTIGGGGMGLQHGNARIRESEAGGLSPVTSCQLQLPGACLSLCDECNNACRGTRPCGAPTLVPTPGLTGTCSGALRSPSTSWPRARSRTSWLLLLALPSVWHRPAWAAALPVGVLLAMLALLILAMDGNMGEAYSVWCFSGVAMSLYYLVLPAWFVWPKPARRRSTTGIR